MRRRRGLVLGLCVALLAGCAPGSSSERAGGAPAAGAPAATGSGPVAPAATARPVEQIKYAISSPTGVFAPVVVARDKGYFREEGIEVEIPAMQAPVAIAGLTSGEIDYTGFFSLTVGAAIAGLPQRVVAATVSRSTRHIMAPPSVRSMEQLRGGVIAVSAIGGGPYGSGVLALEHFGIDPRSEVTWLQAGGATERLIAMQQGAAVAGILSGPEVPQAEALGFTSLLRLDDVAPLPESGVSTAVAKLESQPDQVQRVIRALVRALRFLKSDREGSLPILMQFLSLPREGAEQAYDGVAFAYSDDGTLPAQSLRYAIDQESKSRNLTAPISPADVADFRLLYGVLAEMGIQPADGSAR
jgi:NitT/TauT family transport system substrate-binding protein